MPRPSYREARASLRFMGETLDPLMVDRALRLPHDHVHRMGSPRLSRSKSGKVIDLGDHTEGIWTMTSKGWVDSRKLEVHVQWILDQIEPRAEAIAELLISGVSGDIFCYSIGTTASPPTLTKATRSRVEALGLRLEIDYVQHLPGDSATHDAKPS